MSGGFALTRSDESNTGEFVGSISLSRKLIGDLEGYVECFNGLATDNVEHRATTFNLGLIYWLSDNVQLNAGIDIGLTSWAPMVTHSLGQVGGYNPI